MASSFLLLCYFSMLLTNFLIILQHPPVVQAAASSANVHHLLINVTKQLYFPDFSLSNPRTLHDIKLLGSAKFSKDKSAVEIPNESEAPDLRHLAGRALYSSPIRLLDPNTNTPASFGTTFSFQFRSKTLSSGSSDNGGSGLTFIIVPDELTVGRSGPWLGMLNDACEEDYKVVAVEFDTHYNPEFGDLNDNHVGINLGTIVSSKTINASDVGVFLKDGSVHQAWIRYDGSRRWLDIYLGQQLKLPSKPLFSGSLDLSPFLKEYMFVGFSASTGNMTQIHNVLSWNFTSSSQASLRFPSSETCQTKISVENEDALTRTIKTEPTSSFMIFVAVVVLCLIVLVSLYYNSKRKGQNSSESVIFEDETHRPRPPNKPRRFTLSEISSATRSFGEYEVLGSDNRGTFYRGKLSNGSMVAVKRFSSRFLNSNGLDQRRMVKEISAMSRVRHPNLVPIRGWCHDSRETIVVYDFFSNGGLDQWVFGPGVLPWTRRFKVVKDMADALSFLHSKKLTHKNMKTTSVLLDINFRAVLGDYGFILSGSQSKQFESTVSHAADVFEFGVFTLEVVSGRKRWDPEAGPEEKDLLELAWRMHEEGEKVIKLVDRRMGSVLNMDQAIRVLELGLLCTVSESKGRPSMEKVVEILSLDGPMPELPSNRPVALFPYSSATGLCNNYACTPFK